jgi:hypothetical protein
MPSPSSHEPVYVCLHVFDRTRPVLLVSRTDGDWQFLCGLDHDTAEVPRVIGLSHVVEHDSTLVDILDLPADWEAERESLVAPWICSPCSPERSH